jgi:hypothetical protein
VARIGIKLADGSFFPIIEDENSQRKRMVLTVARPGQTSAQIDLLRFDGETEQYVGCLVLDELVGEGTAELELIVGLDDDGTIDARVNDSVGGQYQSLSVNVRTLESAGSFSLPDDSSYPGDSLGDIGDIGDIEDIDDTDFSPPEEIEEDDLSDLDLEDAFGDESDGQSSVRDGETAFDDGPYPAGDSFPDLGDPTFDEDRDDQRLAGFDDSDELLDEEYEDGLDLESPPRSFSLLAIVAIVLVGLSVTAVAAYLVFRWLRTDAVPDLRGAFVVPLMMRRVWPNRVRRRTY